ILRSAPPATTRLISSIVNACSRGLHIAHHVTMERAGRNGRKESCGVASIVTLALLAFAAPAIAQEPPHVRGESGMQQLIDDAGRRSPAIQEWIDRLQQMDVTVYVRTRVFATLDLDGRVALVSVRGAHRYLLIELACGRSELTQMVTLAHELFHAIEIAAEPSVVSADTLADLYARIGTKTADSGGQRPCETEAAAAAALRARRQLLSTTRQGHGT